MKTVSWRNGDICIPREPEVTDLAKFLVAMGAKIEGDDDWRAIRGWLGFARRGLARVVRGGNGSPEQP